MTRAEEWRMVDGHPYEVSSIGRVRRTEDGMSGNGGIAIRAGTILRGGGHSHGYRVVGGAHLYVHRLVALVFIPNPLGLPNVNHKDGNPANNRADNLEWVTQAENLRHAREDLGRGAPPPLHFGVLQHDAKLNEEKVREIVRLRRDERLTTEEIGRRYGVSGQTIWRVVSGKSWKHVPEVVAARLGNIHRPERP